MEGSPALVNYRPTFAVPGRLRLTMQHSTLRAEPGLHQTRPSALSYNDLWLLVLGQVPGIGGGWSTPRGADDASAQRVGRDGGMLASRSPLQAATVYVFT
jgi:hypothetical protein